MRSSLMLTAALLLAAPAAAQDRFAADRVVELQAQQDMDRQRLNALRNEIYAAETRLRTEQTLRDLQAQREPLRLRPTSPAQPDARPQTPSGGYASIPDDALAASSARVREAARPGR